MKSRITYDSAAQRAYVYVLPSGVKYEIESTDELEVNSSLELDIDQNDRVVGIEFFGQPVSKVSKLAGSKKIYKKIEDVFTLRFSEEIVKTKFRFKGIDFCFADNEFKEFIGIDVVDLDKYDKDLLGKITE